MKYIKSIFEIIDNYDCIFCDINGVITDGLFLFYGIEDTLEKLRNLGKHVIFLSNATRTRNMIKAHLTALGIDKKFLDKIITSGDVLRHFINSHIGEFKDVGVKNRFFVIGNKNFLEGINNINVVSSIDDADYVLLNGVVSDVKINDAYFYQTLLQRQVPFICTNPDKLALVGDTFIKAPAYTAAKYRRLGGQVYSYGKPSHIIYDRVFELYPGLTSLKVLCIGDTLMTDIKGAVDYGLDSLFITSGIMKKLKKERGTISGFFAEHGVIPTYYTECLA